MIQSLCWHDEHGTVSVTDLSYGYDALGNVNATDDAFDEVSRTLGYDKLNRYTDETIYNPNAPNGLGRGTGYSAGGNINNRTLVGSYDYGENGAGPHAVTTISHQGDISHYHYDAAGRMTSGGAFSAIDWNWSGQVRRLEGTPNVYLNYTPDGDLLTKGVDGEGTARYFGKLFVQLGNDGGWRERIVANGEVVALVTVSSAGYPSVNYMVHDNLGSPAAIVDASGVLEGRYAWNMWGELVNPARGNGSDPDADAKEALTTLGYTGHEMFWKAGLVHTHARLYMPGTGRWLSPDPTVPNLYDGQSLNRYSYVLNNPLTYWDPYGYSIWGDIQTSWGNLVINWRTAALGVAQITAGVAGIGESNAIVLVGGAAGAATIETGAGVPIWIGTGVLSFAVLTDSVQSIFAGAGNIYDAATNANPNNVYTDSDVAQQMGLSPAIENAVQTISIAHALNTNFVRTLFTQSLEHSLSYSTNSAFNNSGGWGSVPTYVGYGTVSSPHGVILVGQTHTVTNSDGSTKTCDNYGDCVKTPPKKEE